MERQENKGFFPVSRASSDSDEQNEAGSNCQIGTNLTQPSSADVRGFTYFVRDGDVIKIGSSMRPRRRLNALQTGIARQLEILAIVDMAVADEMTVHQQFAHLRIRGEWFRAEADLIEFIETIKPHHVAGPDVIEPKPIPAKEQPDPRLIAIRDLRRDLIKKRSSLPAKARPIVSNLIEQTLNIHDEADLERMRPFMERQRKRLAEILSDP